MQPNIYYRKFTFIIILLIGIINNSHSQIDTQDILLNQGWNIFSTYINPTTTNMDTICDPIISHVIIIKNGDGNVYLPQYGVNAIGNISLGEGYQIKVDTNVVLSIQGVAIIPETSPMIIGQGWGIIAYLRQVQGSTVDMMNTIESNIIIMKDNNGLVYWPQWGVNLLGELTPGEGYLIKMTLQDTLIYPPNDTTNTIFTCGNQITDFDGNMYNTVQIGSQCWMKENLRVSHFPDGSSIPNVTIQSEWDNLMFDDPAYCYYDNDSTSYALLYGALYNWAAVMNSETSSDSIPGSVQGICPDGWHVPSDEEMKILEGFVDSIYDYPNAAWNFIGDRGLDAGHKLKASDGWGTVSSPGINGNDQFGFSALPGGRKMYILSFSHAGFGSMFWTSTEHSEETVWGRDLFFTSQQVGRHYIDKRNGISVRCVNNSYSIPLTLPTVVTDSIHSIGQNTASIIGNVSDQGGATVIQKGMCWNHTGMPTTDDYITYDGMGEGAFISTLTNLTQDSTYYVRAYAINPYGVAYGNVTSFTLLPSLFTCGNTISDYDGNIYNSILIGSQCWMKENLKTTSYPDGTPLIDGINTTTSSWEDTTKYYFNYLNDTSYVNTYGRLYNWAAVMNNSASSTLSPSGVTGICPTGWHVPSDEEWKILEGAVDSWYDYPDLVWDTTGYRGYDAGNNLKTTNAWGSWGTCPNLYGFSALPGGLRSLGNYASLGDYGHWWTSTEESQTFAFYRGLSDIGDLGIRNATLKIVGYSVRCIKD